MDIDSYIAKYGPEWRRLETACARGPRGLAKLPGEEIEAVVRLYLRASGHLVEVQTRYGDHRLETYLSGVVARAHAAVYGARPATLRVLLAQFGSRYRAAVRRSAPFIAVAAIVLIGVGTAVGGWVANSREAEAGLLPPFAREAIRGAGGDRVDLGIDPASLSTVILVNNVQVSLLGFALGITLGIGTMWVLVQNALLIGSLAGAYHAADKAGTFWALVLPHGLLEITAICVAAGAGLRMGWSIIDPGDRPRGRALVDEARGAVLVVLGVAPALGVAAAIEGFLTAKGPAPLTIGLGAAVAALYLAFLFVRPKDARTP